MKLAIVGSVDLTEDQTEDVEWLVVNTIVSCKYLYGNLEVVSGGAEGVDSIAESAAKTLGIFVEIFEPDVRQWKGFRKSDGTYLLGFEDRNLQIARCCDILVAIRTRQSKTYGSGWTADRAEALGKEVHRFYV